MKRGEKRQKFHEALLQMLYPPPPKEDHQESVERFTQNPNLDWVPDDLDQDRGSTASTDADGGEENGPKKLTRAQRKRLRKKKLKEAASRRRKIIGPLLLHTSENGIAEVGGGGVVEEEPQGVRGMLLRKMIKLGQTSQQLVMPREYLSRIRRETIRLETKQTKAGKKGQETGQRKHDEAIKRGKQQ